MDALNSAKSAIQGGVLPGGGIAMYHASKLLETGLPKLMPKLLGPYILLGSGRNPDKIEK